MYRKFIFLTLGLLTALGTFCSAQETRRVLLLPVDVRGSDETMTSKEVTSFLESAAEQSAPGVDIVMPSSFLEASDDPPSLDDARALLQEYKADSVVWLAVRFRSSSLPTGSFYTRNLTLSAAAQLWIFSAASDSVILNEPVSVVRQTPLSSSVGVATEAAALNDLKFSCGTELASSLVHAALDARNKKMVGAWSGSQTASTETSSSYQGFVRAMTSYQKAVGESDFVAAASAQTNARHAWQDLSEADKTRAQAQYPGLLGWLGE